MASFIPSARLNGFAWPPNSLAKAAVKLKGQESSNLRDRTAQITMWTRQHSSATLGRRERLAVVLAAAPGIHKHTLGAVHLYR